MINFWQKEIPKGPISAISAVLILFLHVALSIYLFVSFDKIAEDEVAVAEISLPITLAYAVTVVTWIIAHQGQVTYSKKVGPLYVIGLGILGAAYALAIVIGLSEYRYGSPPWDWRTLNTYFAVVDGALGSLFLMFCNDLFTGDKVPETKGSGPAPISGR